jgi:hypothetical protein
VPVSVRTSEQHHTLGNRLVVMRGPLPVYIDDPVARLRFVRKAMDGLKESKQAVGAATLTAVNNLAPPTVLAQASRINFSTRLFNLLVTNIPGPQVPLYVLGRELEDLYPIAFLPENHALAIAIMSYNGGIDFGLLGDYDALPDIDVVADGIADSLAELLERASKHRPQPQRAEPESERELESGPGGEPESESEGETESKREAEPEQAAAQGRSAPAADADADVGAETSEAVPPPTPLIPPGHARPNRGPAADMRAKRQRGSRPARRRSES